MITITHRQTDRILDDIQAPYILNNVHYESLRDNVETFDFTTVADKDFSMYLEERNRVIIPSEEEGFIEFVIMESERYREGEQVLIDVRTNASYLELKKANYIRPQRFESYTPNTLMSVALDNTEWRVGLIEVTGNRTIEFEKYVSSYDFLNRIAREFDAELRFRIETNGYRVTGRYVDVLERVGDWRGREVVFGKDLLGIRRIENTEDIVTALIGIGPEQDDGTRLEVFVEDEEALQRWGRIDREGKIQHLIGVYEPQSDKEMTKAYLTTLTQQELQKRIDSVVEYEVNIIDLENVPGLENKKIRKGDTIRIKDEKFNPPLYLEARILEQSRDIIEVQWKDVRLGEYIEYTEEEVTADFTEIYKELESKLDYMQLLDITYTKSEIDTKDVAGNQAKEKLDNEVGNKVIETTDGAQGKANNARDEAITEAERFTEDYAVSQAIYTSAMEDVTRKLSDKAELEYVDGELRLKANADSVYDKFEVDTRLNDKADIVNVYTKTEVNSALNGKVDITTFTTTLDGIVTDIGNHSTAISQNAEAIGLRATTESVNLLEGRVETAEGEISTIAGRVSLKADASTVTSLTNRVNTAEVDINALEGQIVLKADTEITDGLASRLSAAEVDISSLEGAIVLKADTEITDRLGSRMSTAEADIDSLEGAITLKADSSVVTGLNTRLSSAELEIDGLSGEISNKASVTSVNQLSTRIGTAEQTISGLEGEITNKASVSDLTALGLRVGTAEQRISALDGEISNKAEITQVNELGTRINTAEQSINALDGEISSKVSITDYTGDTISSLINQTATSVLIDAERIDLRGYVTADDLRIRGDLTFGGRLEGATGTFSGSIQSPMLTISAPEDLIDSYSTFGLRMQTAIWWGSISTAFKPTGYVYFNTLNNGLEIYKEDEYGREASLEYFNLNAKIQTFQSEEFMITKEYSGWDKHFVLYRNDTTVTAFWDFNLANHNLNLVYRGQDNQSGTRMFTVRSQGGAELHVGDLYFTGNGVQRLVNENGNMTVRSQNGYLYLQASNTVRFTNPDGTTPIKTVEMGYVDMSRSGNTAGYVAVDTRLRVTDGGFWNGVNTNWKEVQAGGFNNSSLEELKQDIELMEMSALEKIVESDIYKYRFKSEVNQGKDIERYGLIIGEGRRTPNEILNDLKDAVSQYDMVSFAWKAIQELYEEIQALKKDKEV